MFGTFFLRHPVVTHVVPGFWKSLFFSVCGHSLAESETVCRACQLDRVDRVGVSTNAQWVVSIAPLAETGYTSPSARAETVEKTPLTSGQVKARVESCCVVSNVGVYRTVSLTDFSSIIPPLKTLCL